MTEESELRDAERILEQRRWRVREPKRIADVVSRLLARRGYAQVEGTVELQQVWQQTVETGLATHSRPAHLRRGVLEVYVRNSAALQELTFQKKRLLQQLQMTSLGQQIRDLRFRVGSFD